MAGLYHLGETARTDRKATIGRDAAATLVQIPGVPVLLPFGPAFGVLPGALITNNANVKTGTQAVYGALESDLDAALVLSGLMALLAFVVLFVFRWLGSRRDAMGHTVR